MPTSTLERDPLHETIDEKGTFTDADPAVAAHEPVADDRSAGPATGTAVEAPAETCTNCHNTEPFGKAEWCPRCGYHPRWKKIFDVGGATVGDWQQPPTPWTALVPPWACVLAAGMLVLLAVDIFAQVRFPPSQRAVWTLCQILAGLVVFSAGHVAAYTYAAAETDKFGPFDLLFKPFGLWRATIRDLPAHAWRVWLAGWGVTAVVLALSVVGGIDWLGIFDEDWGVKRSAQGNLLHEVVDQARRERDGGADNLEDAMKDFAGEEKEKEAKKVRTKKADCLVIGFTTGTKGNVQELLLASVYHKKLRYVGMVLYADLPAPIREELDHVLPLLKRGTPFVECGVSGATWLHPVKVLRMSIVGWTDRGRIKDPLFDQMLQDIRFVP